MSHVTLPMQTSDPSPCCDLQAVLGATDSGQVIVLCPTLEDELRPASRQSLLEA